MKKNTVLLLGAALIAIAAIILILPLRSESRARIRQKNFLSEFKDQKWSFTYDERGNVISISINDRDFSGEILAPPMDLCHNLPFLQEIDFSSTKISDSTIKAISCIGPIKLLDISDTHVTDAAVPILLSMQVQCLCIAGNNLSSGSITTILGNKNISTLILSVEQFQALEQYRDYTVNTRVKIDCQ